MNTSPETRFSLIGRLSDPENAEAWHEFVQLYQPMIYRIAKRRRLQHADAVEVTQEVLTRVARAVEGWDPDKNKGSFRGWLYRIARNATIDHLRKANRQPINLDHSNNPWQDLPDPAAQDNKEFQHEYARQVFHWAAERIQREFRDATWQAFWKTSVEGLSVDQVSQELEMSCGAIYVARSRIMKRLGEEVQKRLEASG